MSFVLQKSTARAGGLSEFREFRLFFGELFQLSLAYSTALSLFVMKAAKRDEIIIIKPLIIINVNRHNMMNR